MVVRGNYIKRYVLLILKHVGDSIKCKFLPNLILDEAMSVILMPLTSLNMCY